jgi:autotransporter-associated beta strand protein
MSVATWDGGSAADANWSTPANWLGDAAPAPGDDLVFPAGAARGNANNDYATGTSFNSISFLDGGYTITGQDVRLTNGVSASNAQGTNTVSLNLQIAANQTFAADGPGSSATLRVDGTVTLAVATTLTLHAGAAGNRVRVGGAIGGGGAVLKTGPGSAELTAINTYGGGTSVAAGAGPLFANSTGTATGTAGVSVAAAGQFGGFGHVASALEVAGVLRPGAAPNQAGTIRVASLALGPTAEYEVEVYAVGPTGYDQLDSAGAVTLGGAALDFSAKAGFILSAGQSFVIINNQGASAVSGTFAGLPDGASFPAMGGDATCRIDYHGGDGNDVVVEVVASTIPLGAGTLSFDSAGVTVGEGAGTATLTVVRTMGDGGTVTADYAFNAGSALPGTDFVTAAGTLVFGDGETSKTIAVPILDDAKFEATEEFSVVIVQAGGGAVVGHPTSATVTITDDDIKANPVAVGDLAVGIPGQPVSIDVKANDSDPGGDPLTVAIATQPEHGTITLAGQLIEYAAADGFAGIDTFTYALTTDVGGAATGVVTVVTGVTVELADPADPATTVLVLGGSSAGDRISFTPNKGGGVQVTVNRQLQGAFHPTGRIIAATGAGDDRITVGKVAVPAQFDAGPGNDTVAGTQFNDVLVGGPGDDRMAGGGGRDLLIGGGGADRLAGGGDDDILIGGAAGADADAETGSRALLAAWASGADYAARCAHLAAGVGNAGRVKLAPGLIDRDGARDALAGDAGRDLFVAVADPAAQPDAIKGRKKDELVVAA